MADKPNPRSPVLNLDEIPSGPLVTIHGEPFEIRHPLSMSLGQIKRVRQLGVDIDALEGQEQLSDEEEARLSALLGQLCGLVLIAPDAVIAKLTDLQRAQVLTAFTQLRSGNPAATGAAAPAKPSSGTKRSRGSRGSTAGRRKSGSGVFRSLSSSRT